MTKHTILEDEEYNYPEGEYVVEQTPHVEIEESQRKGKQKVEAQWKLFAIRNKRALGVLAIALIALIAFQVMNYHKRNQMVQAPVQTVKVQPQRQAPPAAQELLQQEIAALKQGGEQNNQAIEHMQTQVGQLQEQLEQATQTNQQLKQAMVLLLEQVKQVNEHLAQQPRPIVVQKPKMPAPEVVYHVHAIIDDRAWISGSNGLTESVAVGDPIPEYGMVKEIDAVRGMILTTSGKVIRLGLNDY